MMRVVMFTAYELIICVTPLTIGSEFALSGDKQKTIPPSITGCSGGFFQCKI